MDDNLEEFVPRAYQVDLFEIARKQNAIIYLPTGAGKTFIAVMLIKEFSADIRRSYDEGGKNTIFIVNTVPLVTQQSEYIERLTGLSCGALCGEMGIDFWSNTEWQMTVREHQVLVMTAQLLVNALCHGFLLLNRINLIIFDECHRAVSDHPMRQIMQQFEHCPKEEQPRTLGLSASLLNGNVKLAKVDSIIQSLEITFHAKVITTDIGFKDHYAVPQEVMVLFDKYIVSCTGQRIINILEEVKKTLDVIVLNDTLKYIKSSAVFRPKCLKKKIMNMAKCIHELLLCTGIYGASKAALLHLIQLECMKKFQDDEETLSVLQYVITEVTKCRKLFENEMKGNAEAKKIHSYSSDQLRKLYMTMKNFYNSNRSDTQKFCCIVFVQRRVTAEVVFQILKNLSMYDEDYKFLKPDYIVGYSKDSISNREWLCVSKWNKEAMHRFRNGLSNCIVATDIVDEGIDVQRCTLVIRYNLPMDVRSYVQSKGRARHSSSQYILLLPKDDSQYLERYKNFKTIEYHLKKLLVYNTEERSIPTEDAIRDELYHYEIEPYIVTEEDEQRNTLTEQMAIGIVNMYCTSLLNSKFINLAPIWILHEVSENMQKCYQVSLQLPIISPLKTVIFGDTMPSIATAKRSAAMKMCIELHKIGELSDKLVPNTAKTLLKHVNYLFPNWKDETEEETALLGTYKKKRHHELQFPSALYAAFPAPKTTVYIHLLHIAPKYCIPHGDNRHLTFYNLLTNNAGFCIISAKKMPQVPSFPIFMSVGELNVSVKVNYSTTTLCEEEIGYIKSFHTLIFTEIVPIIKPFLVFDNYNLDNCFLIAPVDEHCNINWEVMRQYTYIERILPPDPSHFKASDYELALVVPNYRASADTYIVTQICDDITPNSCFPTENFYSYVHYYKEKHGLTIKNLKQPLFETKAIPRKINYIIPRHTQNDIKNRKYANFQEHLVPELCIKINFPALYWLKATVLPSILHRVSQLLVAEDLRCLIATETKLGLLSNDQWPPLVITDEEAEEPFEPEVEMSATEAVDALQPELPLNGPEIDVLNTEVNHYPWPKDQEPSDLYKNIEDTQLIQIEHYFQFMYESQDNSMSKTKNKIYFRNNPLVNTPTLRVLSQQNLDGPDPVQIMYALTTKMGQDAFHLERLETLGDSYLKFITSLFLYTMFPKYAEGSLTMLKGKIIGNRNLYYCGAAKNIPGRMKVDDFIPLSNFIVPAYTVFRQLQELLLDAKVSPNVLYEIQIPRNEQFDGCISESTKSVMQERVLNWETVESQTGMEQYLGVQTVSDKTVADCVEALIGVYLNSMGIRNAVVLLKWFGIVPNDLNVRSLLYDVPPRSIIPNTNLHHIMPWASDIETKIGYKFQDRELLLQAFTHPSYTGSKITECYQRLEFLGDAILDFLITSYIYEYCGILNPGALTDLRSALVNNITFACLSVRHGLHTALLSYAPELNKIIERFVRFQEERDHAVNDELLWILLEENECNMAEYVDVPKVLGDIYEAVIGAIYLDSKKDLSVVWGIIYSFMHKEIDQFSKNIPKQPIRVLYETHGANPQFLKSIIIENTNMIMVPLKVTVAGTVKLFHGFGANKKQAKCAAAKQALKSLLYKV